MNKWFSSFIFVLSIVLSALIYPVMIPSEVQASCATPNPNFEGVWFNQNSNGFIKKVAFSFNCGDHVGCPIGGQCNQPWTGFSMGVVSSNNGKESFWGVTKTYEDYYRPNVRTARYSFSNARVYLSATIVKSGFKKGQLLLEWRIEPNNQSNKSTTGSAYFTR